MINKQLFFMLLLIIFMHPAIAAVTDTYTFTSEIHKKRFINITKTLKCTVCKNQNLYESIVPQAIDLKNIIADKIKTDAEDAFIYDFLTTRYGETILYKPKFSSHNFILWIFPFIVFILIFSFIFINFFQKK